ncbi:FAD-dependent oxidoreductase [Pseudolabrys sp. FHR47]|uniref:flavin monoamine oxidase family protein n=1 Tax=Pseudolabrys sp. FHR47 TaxID=2562284 RepID=UPI0010BF4DDB|nr:FAD-dependent oxidoreductase [Pseudolabrys sp. FHR47]
MLETAIVGGGICGLALARSLHRQGRSFALFEARPRLGGRILSVTCIRSGAAIDLGPAWFWPETQPLVTGLIAEFGLAHFPQHDQGALLHLREADKTPDVMVDKPVHNGARRLEGGMAGLVGALAKDLPRDCLRFDHVLTGMRDGGDHVALTLRSGDHLTEVVARQAVIALPPRLVEEHIRFEPGLDEATRTALRETETWMAAQAKVAIGYDRPFWRDAGQSGNAFVTHEQAVVGEIFDACDATATKAALGGFLALSPELRQSFSAGLPMLMTSQMMQVFGSALEHGEQHYQDWATEPFTCSTRDRATPRAEHVDFSNPLLRRALWNGKLHFGGSETASRGAGYLEGALEAARRIQRALGRADDATAPVESASTNAASLARFSAWVAAQGETAFDKYHQHLNRSLAAQKKQQLTQWAILGSVEEIYGEALEVLNDLRFDMSAVAVERGRSALMPDVQKPFRDLMQALLDDVIAFNRTSCALSNFPDEHHPSKEYMQTILRDVAAVWQEFSLSANRLLLAKAETASGRRPQTGAATGMSL